MKPKLPWLRRATRSAEARPLLGWRARLSRAGRASNREETPAPTSFSYAPHPDGQPDPGEVVWTWVPYEDDPSQGKDRPVLLIGRTSLGVLLGLYLTSKDHDRDATQEARAGRFWLDIGTGAWDSRGRPSEVRLNRLLHVDPDAVRREGAAVSQPVFDQVIAAATPYVAELRAR